MIQIKRQPVFFGRLTAEKALKWTPSLALWGVAAGAGVMLFAEGIPIINSLVFEKLPVVGGYYRAKRGVEEEQA